MQKRGGLAQIYLRANLPQAKGEQLATSVSSGSIFFTKKKTHQKEKPEDWDLPESWEEPSDHLGVSIALTVW